MNPKTGQQTKADLDTPVQYNVGSTITNDNTIACIRNEVVKSNSLVVVSNQIHPISAHTTNGTYLDNFQENAPVAQGQYSNRISLYP
ncbi:MAG TPA: hypothetical protein VLQ80_21335, partial [Candidatus Saccharimonadia bacterium]|nr:hypothetical protein [Candidatus Saccharimonadia bacterium]